MTTKELIDLFSHEMINEIYHSTADDSSKDNLVAAVHEVADTVLAIYETPATPVIDVSMIFPYH